jgi:acetolactate synthase-1/2/3 large subunit
VSQELDFAHALRAQGLALAFGVTGSGSSWKLITALEDLGARYLPASHEAAAAIMAGAAWRASGRISASIGIKGPGLANMLPGIAFNAFENLPVLSVCEAYGPGAPAHRMHKRMNQPALLGAVCKGSIALASTGERLAGLVAHANTEAPGPVHVDLCDGSGESVPWSLARPAEPRSESRDQALRMLDRASRPILIVGSLAMRREWSRKLADLSLPLFTTAAAKGVTDEAAANVLGVYTGDGKELAPESRAFAQADLVVALGLRNVEVLTPRAPGPPLLCIDEVEVASTNGFAPAVFWSTREQRDYVDVLDRLQPKTWGAELAAELRAKLMAGADPQRWLPAACFLALNALQTPYSLVVDTGSFCTIAEHYSSASPRRQFFGSSNGRYMGGSIPTAIGAAATGERRTPVFCVCGDGGMRMYLSEIALAAAQRLPICFVLMSDGRYGSVAAAARGARMSQGAISPPMPPWRAAIEQLGCEAQAADDPSSFAAAIGAWRADAPLFIECAFAPEPYMTMTDDLR